MKSAVYLKNISDLKIDPVCQHVWWWVWQWIWIGWSMFIAWPCQPKCFLHQFLPSSEYLRYTTHVNYGFHNVVPWCNQIWLKIDTSQLWMPVIFCNFSLGFTGEKRLWFWSQEGRKQPNIWWARWYGKNHKLAWRANQWPLAWKHLYLFLPAAP